MKESCRLIFSPYYQQVAPLTLAWYPSGAMVVEECCDTIPRLLPLWIWNTCRYFCFWTGYTSDQELRQGLLGFQFLPEQDPMDNKIGLYPTLCNPIKHVC